MVGRGVRDVVDEVVVVGVRSLFGGAVVDFREDYGG